jgi:hypothetical protein
LCAGRIRPEIRVCPIAKIYLEQSTITEFISYVSSPAPDPQPIIPPGVLPTQAPPATLTRHGGSISSPSRI